MKKNTTIRAGLGARRFARGAAATAVALSCVAWGTGLGPATAAPASDGEQEFTLEQLLTPVGGDKPDAVTGEGIESAGNAAAEDGEIATIVVQLEKKRASLFDPFQLFSGRGYSHDSIRAQIQKIVDGAVENDGMRLLDTEGNAVASTKIEEVTDYTHVIDGFAIKAPAGIVADIRGIEGVKNAYVDEVYALPQDQGDQNGVENISTLEMTGANKVSWRGEGQVIAIIDSGLQTNHEAFAGDLADDKVAFTEEQIQAAQAGLEHGGAKAKYVNEKIVYCYDYADKDSEVTPGTSTDLSHGTHVAGIAAANGGKIEGTAPDAQIMMFKVCDDFQGSIRNSWLLDAMDDLAALDEAAEKAGGHGIDSMNMSIGSDNGFTDRASDTFGDAVQALEDRGITSNIAAGNSYSSGRGNKSGANLPYATDPDEGLVSSPATHDGAVAVASVNSSQGSPCFFYGEDYIEYQQLTSQDGSSTAQFSNLADGAYAVVDGGIGSAEDTTKASEANDGSLAGKMVLIQRGGEQDGEPLTFQKKAENFAQLNPVAVIIYNNVAEVSTNFGLSSGLDIPVVGISLDNGQKMIDAMKAGEEVKVRTESGALSPDAGFGTYTMSDFSSWGAAPELEIKPEITAPGGNVYSSVTGSSNAYSYMSGTSMATPQMAGISAQVSQYVNADEKFEGMSVAEKHDLVTELLMSTARPIDEPGEASYYPVREQGAGLADVVAATSTPVYLTVGNASIANRPKADLGESEQGTWTFAVTLHNKSDQAVSYTPETHAISDTVADGLFQHDTKDWTGVGISVTYGGAAYDAGQNTVSIAARSDATYTVTITCDDAFKAWAADNTPNGAYVEGYALLKGASEGAVDLSTPFLGFYGDWDAVPAFDAAYTDVDDVHVNGTVVANGKTGTPLGINPLDSMAQYAESYAPYIHTNKYVVSNTTWSSSPSSLVPLTGLLRNVKGYTADYKNAAGVSVKTYDREYVGKAYYNSSYGLLYAEQLMGDYPAFTGKDESGKPLADGKYTLHKTVTTAGGDNGTQADEDVEFYYDTAKPRVTDVTYDGEGDERTVSFKVTDNSWLSAVSFNDPSTGGYIMRRLADDENLDGSARTDEKENYTENADGTRTWEFTVKISDIVETWDSYDTGEQIPNTVNLYCYDYGLSANDAVKIVIRPVAPKGVSVSPDEMTLYAGQEGAFTAAVEPEDATETNITWTSSDEEVATVNSAGVVHAVKNGEATITATMDYDSSLTASAKLSVTDVPEDVGIAMMSGEMTLPYGESGTARAILAPAYAEDAVTWTSDNEEVATVEGAGAEATVTAGEHTGDATLTASVTHGGTTYEASMKVKVRSDDYGDFVVDEDYEQGPRLLYYAGYRNEVTVPDNVKVIGPQAFAGTAPATVTVPAGVEKVEDEAFYYMPNLKTVYFEDTEERPSQLKTLGDKVFYYTLALEEITLPSNVTKIGTGVFMTTTATKVVCPESLREIPAETFYYGSISDVTISDRVTSIGDNAFAANSVSDIKLVGVSGHHEGDPLPTGLPSSLVHVGKNAFSGLGAKELVMPSGLKTIDYGGFSSTAATRVVLNDGLESIGGMGFAGCNAAELAIPDSVRHVGLQAFSSMANCKTFAIGKNVPADELDQAFVADYACKEFVVADDCANYSAIGGVLFNKDATKLVSITEGAQENNGTYAVPDGVEHIAAYGFYDTKLASVDMPQSLKTVGSSCFASANLTSVKFPDGFETVYNGAFQNCDKVRSVDLGGTQAIKRYAFATNVSLVELDMRPDLNRLEVIDEGAFSECAGIKEFVFPDSLKAINGMSMINMPALQKVHIGAGLTSSLAGAFTGDPNLSQITVSEDNPVYHADNNVLYGIMSEETDPEYPGKHLFLSLPTNTFSEYTVEEGTVVIDAQAFRNNTSLRKVKLPEGLKKLCTGSFNSCSNLAEIDFPDSLEYVTGLYSTSSLKIADFGTKIKEIEDNAFMGDMPQHIIVRGGQNGKFTDGMDFTGDEHGADTAYFGPGMTDITFSWTETPNILVVPADAKALSLKSPTASDIPNFYVYVPAGSDGEEAVKAALKKSNISESHIRDYTDLSGTLAIGTPEGDDEGGQDVVVTSYTIPVTWLQTGTDTESSAASYLSKEAVVTYAGAGAYKVSFTAAGIFSGMIADMLYNGKSMEKDGSSFIVTLDESQLKERVNIAFKINTGSMVMTQDCDVAFDQTAVQNMVDDVAANNTGNSAGKMELLAAKKAEPGITAGGIVTTGTKTDVYVSSKGGVVGSREYRFVETSPDGSELVVQNWSGERACTWQPVTNGATLTAQVRDATKLSVQTAGVLRCLNKAGQEANVALNDLIDSLSSIKKGQRADDVYEALQEAIAGAQEVASNNNATTAQIQDALSKLQEAAAAYNDAPRVTRVGAAWFKEGTYGTDGQEESVVGSMLDGAVGVSGPDGNGAFAIDLNLTEQAAGMMKSVSCNGTEAVKVDGDTYRVFAGKAALGRPLTVSFTYAAGQAGETTHVADVVLDADGAALAVATVTEVPVSWFQTGTDSDSQAAGFIEENALVRAVGGTYLLDLTTNVPEWLTNMRIGDVEAAGPEPGVFRFEVTEEQLGKRMPIDMFVVPMGNRWTSADAVFDAAAVNAAIEAAAVDAATDALLALPAADDIDVKDAAAVKAAQEAYSALSDQAKGKVSADAVKQLDAASAAVVRALIAGLGDDATEEQVAAARVAYDALSGSAADMVSSRVYQKLVARETAIEAAKRAAEEAAGQGGSDQGKAVKPATTPAAKPVVVNAKKVTASAVKAALKKANNPNATTVTLGSKVKTIAKGAFKGTKVTTLVAKTKKLTKKSVKGSLKGSKVKTVQVAVGKKKANKKYVKKYKKIFTKKIAGKKAKVK